MKIRRKLLFSYLLIVALFVAAGATITYNTMKMADLQNKAKTQLEINNNAYAYQQGLDQIQFGTLMYASNDTTEGQRIIVASAEIMQPAETYLLSALADNPALLNEFNQVVSLDRNVINGAVGQVYSIYTSDANDTQKYVDIWGQLSTLMNAVNQGDAKLADVRSTTLANVENASSDAQNYANISLIIAVAFLAIISAVSVVLAVVMGNRITRPLKKLADIAHKVSLGDLNQRFYLKQNIDIKTGDEIDELVDAFRRMVNAFRMTEALSNEAQETKLQ
jgi:nitrogen fixation/metabolism regulation signal transduction histidine kinase